MNYYSMLINKLNQSHLKEYSPLQSIFYHLDVLSEEKMVNNQIMVIVASSDKRAMECWEFLCQTPPPAPAAALESLEISVLTSFFCGRTQVKSLPDKLVPPYFSPKKLQRVKERKREKVTSQ